METWQSVLWFLGMWFCGRLVISVFGMQIGIVVRCSYRLMVGIRNDYEYWDSWACKKYLNGVVIKNTIIITVLTALVVWLVPPIGVLGYLIGAVLCLIFNIGDMGLNDANVEESCQIFLRFARPGMAEEMAELLHMHARTVQLQAMLRK